MHYLYTKQEVGTIRRLPDSEQDKSPDGIIAEAYGNRHQATDDNGRTSWKTRIGNTIVNRLFLVNDDRSVYQIYSSFNNNVETVPPGERIVPEESFRVMNRARTPDDDKVDLFEEFPIGDEGKKVWARKKDYDAIKKFRKDRHAELGLDEDGWPLGLLKL